MISNTTASYKLKASKSSRDLHNDENCDNESIDENITKALVYTSRDGRYKGPRSRQTEFRHARIAPSERRGYRGRGASVSRRDREFPDSNSYGYGRKFHDSLSRNTDSASMYFRSKCYEPEKKSEIKFNLPEDTRISKLLRRLSMESDQENSLTISKKLLEVLLIPDNAHYVRKAFHILGDSMLDILRVAPGMLAKKQAAKALGRMGYIMGQENDFSRFQDWMFNRMTNESDDIRYLFMKSLKETLEFEAKKCVLQDHAENLIHDLVGMIEIVENPTLFKSTLDVLITLVEIYPEEFYGEFRDAVDILLGWHVDLAQPLPNIEFISRSLERIKKHFQINLDFSITLVHHFLEDIEACAKELSRSTNNSKENDTNSLSYMTVSILALNTVLKCLGSLLQPGNNELVTLKFVTDCMLQVIQTLTDTLELYIPDNLIIATNENISLLLAVLNVKTSVLYNSIYNLINVQLSLIERFSDSVIISMLLMISKVIKELSANLPLELVQKLVGSQSEIIKLRYSPCIDVQEALICLYHALLNLKNIPLLQEAYRCVLGDLEVVYKQIVPSITQLCQNNPFIRSSYIEYNPESAALFLLRCVSQLANSSSSIIGLWALKPSMLELLAVLLEPHSKILNANTPFLQYGLLYLLYSHCKCYNHFIASSSLVSKLENATLLGLIDVHHIADVTSNSPNSGNFALILDVLHKTLNTVTYCESILLLLQWLNEVLVHSEPYLIILYNRPEFIKVAEILIKCGYSTNYNIVLAVSENLKKLLHKKELSWSNVFLTAVNELCVLHMNSNNKEIRDIYTNLSENIPWDLAVIQFNRAYSIGESRLKCNSLENYNNYSVVLAQHLHLSGSVYGEMLPLHFMMFMKYLLNGKEHYNNWLEDIFMSSWPLEYDSNVLPINMEGFRTFALNSRVVLNNWATYEAAQLCVNSKLRTPLGKPNETFTSFEIILKQLAKDVMKTKMDVEESSSVRIDQNRVRLLLQFMEHLEKGIYNAAEGCALAIPQPSKPVRTFFHTNASTCKEWLSRIRIVIVHVALHAGLSTTALRHGQALLKNLVLSDKTKTVEFERALMYITIALLNLRETEAVYGLYMWCKKVADRKLEWIKYASEQANKRYEIAAENYKQLLEPFLNETTKTKEDADLDPQVQCFISDQIQNCYKELNYWNEVAEWQNRSLKLNANENGIKYSFTRVDYDCAQAIADESMIHAFNQLNTWKECENNKVSSWSIYNTIRETESKLYNVALTIDAPEKDILLSKINESLSTIQERLQDSLLSLPSEFLQTFSLMHYIGNGLKSVLNNSLASNVFLVSENFENDIENIDSVMLSKILWWSEYFSRDHQNTGFNSFCSSVRLNIIRRARKEKNFKLALLHINKFLSEEDAFKLETVNQDLGIAGIGNLLIQKSIEISTGTIDIAKAVKESIKLLYATDDGNKSLVFNLCAVASTAFSKNAEIFCNPDMRQISSRILLKLANWLQNDSNTVSLTEISSALVKFLMVLPEIGIQTVANSIIPINELAIGKLLHFSVQQCATLAKTWFAFGTWCYRWGRKIVDYSSNIKTGVMEEDKLAVCKCLPMVNEEELMMILEVLYLTPSCNEDDIDQNELNTSEVVQDQLRKIPILYRASEEQLQELIQIWKNSQKRIYAYYELSADAYFKYLHLVTNSDNVTKSVECNTITATLRLLRLIVKHAFELQNVLENGLATTPTHPWKVIIPQLFSRLNHPEAYVRQRVSEFLCRVAQDAPHLITFPAVVGAVEGGVKFDFSEITIPKDCFSQTNDNTEDNEELNEIEDAYESDHEESKNVLQSCFKSMVETLSKQALETITQVQLLVKELRRITLLWDELWLGTLAQYHGEIIQRQHQLEVEIEKVNENTNLDKDEKISLITEKYRIIMKPIVFILEQLQSVTSVDPETPHEKQFQERYSDTITEVLEKLKNPDNPDKPLESWQPLKLLQSKFQQKAHKRTSYTLKMQDISPILANMKDTVIAMPGLAVSSKTFVNISGVSNHISILPTKTKPKKLVFYGSDGQTYTYLFKGLEDLHLDERIMQFLSIANTMMAQGDDRSSHNLYRARHYPVIPLGPRSGLISWVDGTTPVFALYKRWQQREAAKANIKTSSGHRSNSNPNIGILRPSELFYNKLKPLLQEHGVKNPENRKEWPLAILKQVLSELRKETPSDLLAKELWCHSVHASEWWQVIKNYSYSVAVMSTIGYIIGLGDRHLDNVLVDLTSGEVVHIDYNVCFEKGKTLRVPEKVPFRLTPNIEEALGVTGIEGIFRLACENVLKTMKKGRETILTLLEAFVYDPLVDWTVGGEGLASTAFRGVAGGSLTRKNRKELEKEITLSMYSVRCTEMKIDWNGNKNEILQDIPNAIEKLQYWLEEHQKISHTEDLLQDLHQQMTLVKEAEANGAGKHILYTLPTRYETYRKAQEAVGNSKKELEQFIHDVDRHIKDYNEALKVIESHQYSQWIMELNISLEKESSSVFNLVKEFLHNAGQSSMVVQCEQSETEVEALRQGQIMVTTKCLNLLQNYGNIYTQCPLTYKEKHRMYYFLNWSKCLLECNSTDGCEQIYQQFCKLLETLKTNAPIKPVMELAYNLNVQLNETNSAIASGFEELEKIKESNDLAENVYTNAQFAVSSFLRNEKDGLKALKYIVLVELTKQNKDFLNSELSISRNSNVVLKLVSQKGGDWFLDDLLWHSNNVVQFVSYPLLQQNFMEDKMFLQAVNGMRAVDDVYKSLHEMHFNFHTIILPESMKKILNEEPTVLHMITELNNLVLSVGFPLPELVTHLEKHLTCIVMEMDDNPFHNYVMDLVTKLKSQYQTMVVPQSENLSQGKMLLLGFDGLFQKLDVEFQSLTNTLSTLEIPLCWRKVDQVKQARSLAAPIFNTEVKAVLDDIFLLKRLQTMYDFFKLTIEMCKSFMGTVPVTVYNDEQLNRPIKKFIADYVTRQFLGIATETVAYAVCILLKNLGLNVTSEIEQKDIGAENKVSLDELNKKGGNLFLKDGIFKQNTLAQASSLMTNLKTSLSLIQDIKQKEQSLEILQATTARLQNQITAHTWLHENILFTHGSVGINTAITRTTFMHDLKNDSFNLKGALNKIGEVREQQKTLISSVISRLNWAAGVNPDVNQVLTAFEAAVSTRDERLEIEHQIANLVFESCNIILQHELLKTQTPESEIFDKRFINILNMWKNIFKLVRKNGKTEEVTRTEENIMQLYTPDLMQNSNWIEKISEKLSEVITDTQKKLSIEKENTIVAVDGIRTSLEKLKSHFSKHNKLMLEVKSLIKSMAKIDESSANAQEFIMNYKRYTESLSPVLHCFKKETNYEEIVDVLKNLLYLKENTESVYEALINLERRNITEALSSPIDQQEELLASPMKLPLSKQENTIKGQQRNAYAMGVWRRIRLKLEGRDPDPGKKYTTQEQVDYIIREASSLDNLALMYEGWTPWV